MSIQHRIRAIMINQTSFQHVRSHQFLQTVQASILLFSDNSQPPQLFSYGCPSARFSVNKFRKNENKRRARQKAKRKSWKWKYSKAAEYDYRDLCVRRILTFVGIRIEKKREALIMKIFSKRKKWFSFAPHPLYEFPDRKWTRKYEFGMFLWKRL